MGLDNGIVIELPDDNIDVPDWIPRSKFSSNGIDDICYWRKCWGIRGAILSVLDPERKHEDECNFPIEAEDIPALIRALKPFFSKEYWERNSDSIWEFDEMFETLVNQVVNLRQLKDFLQENPDVKCYFYDSY